MSHFSIFGGAVPWNCEHRRRSTRCLPNSCWSLDQNEISFQLLHWSHQSYKNCLSGTWNAVWFQTHYVAISSPYQPLVCRVWEEVTFIYDVFFYHLIITWAWRTLCSCQIGVSHFIVLYRSRSLAAFPDMFPCSYTSFRGRTSLPTYQSQGLHNISVGITTPRNITKQVCMHRWINTWNLTTLVWIGDFSFLFFALVHADSHGPKWKT